MLSNPFSRRFRHPDALCPDWIASFGRDRRGATAVEFGLVGIPFLALLGAIVQFAFMIWANQNFDFLFQQAARRLFTGQFQTNNKGVTDPATLLAALRSNMCASKPAVFDCTSVKLDVRVGTNFASSTPVTIVDPATRDWASGFGSQYACAGPGKIVIATGAVKFPGFFNLLNPGVLSFADGSALLQSTLVFRTEPYAAAGASPC